MPAVIRGGGKKGGGKRAPAAYAPTKLRSAAAAGMDPRAAVWIATAVAGAAVLAAMAIGGAARVEHGLGSATGRLTSALGFRLKTLTIKGADPRSTPAIAEAAALHPGDPILAVDLDKLRERVEGVGWVKTAAVKRLLPDAVVVTVKPRRLLAVWQHGDGANVIDAEGAVVPEAQPAAFAQLPLIVGEGANEAAAQMLPLIEARPRLMSRVDAFQRVDGRRWRLALKGGGVIDLPAKDEDQALLRFDQLDAQLHYLDVGFERIDLRDPSAVAVRLKGAPTPAALQPTAGGTA